jgi:nucleotide-binding universal stress UspA family protein
VQLVLAEDSSIALHPLGIILAVLFAACIGGLLVWMFHVPAPIAREVARARRSVSGIRRILVPTRGAEHDQRAVELACRLGQEQRSQIVLAYVLEIPLTLSLNTPLPDEEEKANDAVRRSVEIVKLHGLEPMARVERDREAGRGILRTAKDLEVDLVVIGMNPARSHFADPLGRTTETLLRNANFEVIVDKYPALPGA